ncbi:MAG: SpoVR family protein [Myxococcales bacterium]|jgi:stage V sporulation protein R|nr:SpoVR family protein [Myxococcales bacterium]
MRRESRWLAELQQEIEGHARAYGLDFFETHFELCDCDTLNMVAACGGFPNRYPHWRFGMEFDQFSKGYTHGLSKIYELVINTDPCHAFLLDSNTRVAQKLVMAHVFGHSDFFKNNFCFAPTNRKMLDEMGNHATRIRRWIDRLGVERVEGFIDTVLSLENLIDLNAPYIARRRSRTTLEPGQGEVEVEGFPVEREYMRRYINPEDKLEDERRRSEALRTLAEQQAYPELPERDVLLFLIERAPLESWEADLLSILREETLYFAPQARTKIMNEGWASYWHSTLMTERLLEDSEVVDYAEHCAATLGSSPGSLNPYKLGLCLFRDIERRWNEGRFGPDYEACDSMAKRQSWDEQLGLGREKIFEVRRHHSDVTFIEEFLTPELCVELKLFAYDFNEKRNFWELSARDFQVVRERLLCQLTNLGQPIIEVVDASSRTLTLMHRHEGMDLQLDHARQALRAVQTLWKGSVALLTMQEGKEILLRSDGGDDADTRRA